VFSAEEIDTVAELFDGYLSGAEKSGYHFLSACDAQGTLLGFACWGPASLSRGAADLYWICTARAAQGQGVAGDLFHAVEAGVRGIGRWLLVIWTSSQAQYAPARRFYARMGCELAAQLADFYDRGDDLCIFTKRIE
jgi:GNAT superfamily N-acetyltransferase